MPSLFDRLINRIRGPKLTTPERTLNIFKNGVREVDEGHPKKAIEYFSEAIKAAPNSAKLHHYRADAFALSGDYDQAIVDYDIAVRLNPSYPDTYLDRGNTRYLLGHLETALKDFSEAIRLKPEWGEAYANRAVIHVELSNDEDAEADVAKAKSLGVDESQLANMLEAAHSEISD